MRTPSLFKDHDIPNRDSSGPIYSHSVVQPVAQPRPASVALAFDPLLFAKPLLCSSLRSPSYGHPSPLAEPPTLALLPSPFSAQSRLLTALCLVFPTNPVQPAPPPTFRPIPRFGMPGTTAMVLVSRAPSTMANLLPQSHTPPHRERSKKTSNYEIRSNSPSVFQPFGSGGTVECLASASRMF